MKTELKDESKYDYYNKTLILTTTKGEELEISLETAAMITWDLMDALNLSVNEMEDISDKIGKKLQERGCL